MYSYLQILVSLIVLVTCLGKSCAKKMSDCETLCGNVTIPFPFGSGSEHCYLNPYFQVTCDRQRVHDQVQHILFYGTITTNIHITDISLSTGEMEINKLISYDCYNASGQSKGFNGRLTLNNFRISTKNRLVAIGCDTYAYMEGTRGNESIGSGCITTCDSTNTITNGSCSGVGCCEITIPEGMSYFEVSLSSYDHHKDILGFDPCSYAFVIREDKFNFSSNLLRDLETVERMPMLLDWAIGNLTCDKANEENSTNFLCKGKSTCDKNYRGPGYRCQCLEGYEGNPYVTDGCTNINECDRGIHDCVHDCIDTEGSFNCSCGKGEGGTGCTKDQSLLNIVITGTLVAVILSFVLISWVYFRFKNHKDMMLREKFFRQNGGIMLQQRIRKEGNSHGQVEVIFTMEELKRATDNYDESKIIGKGGYGTVYKGVLSDNRIVAIKKSKLADQTRSQIDEFINEVVILSQINHRNVVKLIGCCLETEVPLLVYEFIPNGTLSDHIHKESKSMALTWDIRLRIATGTAGALSYLHCAASVPIIHRDIKPTNILLDDNYVAKVADFGASKLIPVDQIELETLVRGTLGYLDPEYLQTNQLIEKSDVYSFGVVLVELLTGRKALSFNKPEEERSVAKYFLSSLEDGRLFQVLDEHLQLKELPNEIMQVSRLAERCLRVKGIERPTMKEVTMELEGIMASMIQKHPWLQSSAKEEEGEHLLKQSAGNYIFTDGASGSSGTFDSICREISLSIPSGR
uniref:putative wall-associated receptor kinase-like 16 n=1 Tax=Erigeron canadensis TaxID=72917 RepID=UPI001CB8E176|nr:putative wall-associated receptor kinase-like 16 [Erigeron canadensis]